MINYRVCISGEYNNKEYFTAEKIIKTNLELCKERFISPCPEEMGVKIQEEKPYDIIQDISEIKSIRPIFSSENLKDIIETYRSYDWDVEERVNLSSDNNVYQDKKNEIKKIINIFETGKPEGDYGKLTLIEGDRGGLTYGRSQTTINSGGLEKLFKNFIKYSSHFYVKNEIKENINILKSFMESVANKESDLIFNSEEFKKSLKALSETELMRKTQDSFFDESYWRPAASTFNRLGLELPLSLAVVYDSFIHGNFYGVRKLFPEYPPYRNGEEKKWTTAYVEARKNWLESKGAPLSFTTYRMDAFIELIEDDNWDLNTPFRIRGYRIG